MLCLPPLFMSAAVFFPFAPLPLDLFLSLNPPPRFSPVSLLSPLLFFPPVLMEELREWVHLFCLWRLSDPTGLKVPFLSLWYKEDFKHYSLLTSNPITLSRSCTLPLMGHVGSHSTYWTGPVPELLLSIHSRYVGAAVGVERVHASWSLITMKFHGKVHLFIS